MATIVSPLVEIAEGGRSVPRSVLSSLLEEAPEIFQEVIKRANPTDRAMLFRVSRACRAAVQESGLPRAGQSSACPLPLKRFTGSVEMLKWARANGGPWNRNTCSSAAGGGHLEVLQWARENKCPWDKWTCAEAASGGHLHVLQWARANGCPWDERACSYAALEGHL